MWVHCLHPGVTLCKCQLRSLRGIDNHCLERWTCWIGFGTPPVLSCLCLNELERAWTLLHLILLYKSLFDSSLSASSNNRGKIWQRHSMSVVLSSTIFVSHHVGLLSRNYANPFEWGTEHNKITKNARSCGYWTRIATVWVWVGAKSMYQKGRSGAFRFIDTPHWGEQWNDEVPFSFRNVRHWRSKQNKTRHQNDRKAEWTSEKREGRRRLFFLWDGWTDKRIVNELLCRFVLFIFGRSSSPILVGNHYAVPFSLSFFPST